MKKNILLAVIVFSFAIACKKDTDTGGGNTTPVVDVRDKFIGTWEGVYKFEIPNLPTDNPILKNLPDSVPATVTIAKSQAATTELLIKINFTINAFSDIEAKAFVNGNRYFYEPFSSNIFGFVDFSFRGDGLLGNDGSAILEEGSLKISSPSLVGVWSSNLKRKN